MTAAFSPDVHIRSGKASVFCSGCVHSYDADGLVIDVGNLSIEFVFKELGSDPDLSIDVKSDELLRIELKNFSSPTGVGTEAPIKLGIMEGQKLSVAFTVYSLSKTSVRMLAYTFFLGGE